MMSSSVPVPDRPLRSSTDATVLLGIANGNSKRPSSRNHSQPPVQQAGSVKPSMHLTDTGNGPLCTGAQQAQLRSVPVEAQRRADDDDYLSSNTNTGQLGPTAPNRDSSVRASKDRRPASRPGVPAVQSPYLQPPGGRAAQVTTSRPSSRPQSQPSQFPQQPLAQAHTIPSPTASGASQSPARIISTPGSVNTSSSGARIAQAYGAPPPRPLPSTPSAPLPTQQPHSKSPTPPPMLGMYSRSIAEQPPQPQQVRATSAAQQQQQQAGPRATTAMSGPRASQRGRVESSTGSVTAGETGPGQPTGRTGPPASASGTSAPPPYSHHPGQQGGSHLGYGGTGGRDVEMYSTSFAYDDIPEEDDESAASLGGNFTAYNVTLDQYMQQMITTPASAAATSGLGVSADSAGSPPCSPGNASTRTEEDDGLSPGAMSPAFSRGGTAGSSSERLRRSVRRGPAAGSPLPTGQSPGAAGGAAPRLAGGSRGVGVGASTSVCVSPGPANPTRSQLETGVGQRGGGSGVAGVALGGGLRCSTSNTQLPGRWQYTGVVGPSGRAACSYEEGVHAVGGGSGMNQDVAAFLDAVSSDDEMHNPSALLNSPRSTRRLSSRASAMAFSNALDLRPATAAVISSPSMTRGDPNAPRGMTLGADTGNHHAMIKQVDLGGLSASLFTPNPNSSRETSSPASTAATTMGANSNDHAGSSNPSSPDVAPAATSGRGDRRSAAAAAGVSNGAPTSVFRTAGPSSGDHAMVSSSISSGSGGGAPGGGKMLPSPKAPVAAIPPPWGVSAREGAFCGGQAGDGVGGAGSLQALAARPLSSRGRPAVAPGGGGGDNLASSPNAAAATAVGRAAAANMKWAKPQQPKADASSPLDLPPEARLLAAEGHGMARPPTRQVQSARPPGARCEVELDPSVWQANIAMQLQRPPSRQKPPPEALHLWTPEQQMGMLASGAGLGRTGSSGRPMGGRPQSAAPATYRGSRPSSGPSVKAHGLVGDDVAGTVARPPSRQKPPPLSTLLEHDDFPPPPPAGSRRPRPGADQLDVVVSGSEDDDDDSDM